MIRTTLLAVVPLIAGFSAPNGGGAARAVAVRANSDAPNILFAIADDWSWPHAGAYGDRTVRSPVFDRVAAQGLLFTRAFCVAPSCTASRAAILTGQAIHRLEEGANLWGILPARFACLPDLLEARGYAVGYSGKGWGPGSLEGSGRTRNPAGPAFKNFDQFLRQVPDGHPFFFWFGSHDPHRPYERDSGIRGGLSPDRVMVPPFLPDTDIVRRDILDYYGEVERFDRDVGHILELLGKTGRAEQTMVVITSDNGMPFPRAKANLYEYGTHMPLTVRWPGRVAAGAQTDAFVSFTDFTPTFLEAAGIDRPAAMTGHSFMDLLSGGHAEPRDAVFLERERHANVRRGDLSYPSRAIRTAEFLYVRNYRPDRWPAGDPEMYKAVGPFGDVDASPSKQLLLSTRSDAGIAPFFRLAFEKRTPEELYDLANDPGELSDVAARPEYADAKSRLAARLTAWLRATGDPRATVDDDRWDRFPYFGPGQ